MKIAHEEIFGPAMSLMKLRTVDEAIERAKLHQMRPRRPDRHGEPRRRQPDVAVVWVNCYYALDPDAPFGGYKMSGFGRDMDVAAIDKY